MRSKDKIDLYKRKIKNDPANPDHYYKLAKTYTDLNSLDEAIIFFQKAIEVDGHHVKSYLELANLLFAVDRIDKAVEVCQLGIDYNPESSAIYYLLEQLYEILGEYELASQTLEDLINMDEGYSKAYEALSRLSIFQNRLDEALVWLNKLVEIDPKNVNAYIYLANIYRKKKEFNKAISYLESAIYIEPENLDIYNDLGLVYLESANYDKAKQQFEYVISKDSNYSFAFDNLGVIYRKIKNYQKAEEVLKKSLSMGLQAWTYNELALVYTETGRYKEAIDYSKKALTIDKNYTYALDNLGAVYRKLGYYDKAEEVLKNSLDLKPEDSWTYNQLGLLYYEQGEYISAKTDFIKSSELDPGHYWPKVNIASCYIKEKQYSTAENYLNSLMAQYKDNSRVFMIASKLNYILDNYDKAIEFGNAAIEKDEHDALAIVNLASIYRDLNDYEQAEKFFKRALSSPRPKDSSVYMEYAIFNIFNNEFDKGLYHLIKAQEADELNYNVYCLMAIIENSSDLETRLMDYIKSVELHFKDKKEIFMCYATIFLELGLPEEAEKYFNLALRVQPDYKDAQYGLSQAYYLMGLAENSLNNAFFHTDNTQNVELSSYCNAIVALNYKKEGSDEKFEKYKMDAMRLNPTIQKEFYQKFRVRHALKYKERYNFLNDLQKMFLDKKTK